MERIDVHIKGVRPLLMHAIPQTLGQRQRAGQQPDPRDEAEQALYRDSEGNIGIPSLNVLSCMKQAAREHRVPGKGRTTYTSYIYSGLELQPLEFIPLCGNDGGPPSWEVDIRPVVVQRARILRARPKFNEWELKFQMVLLDPILRPETLKAILEDAGKYVGFM